MPSAFSLLASGTRFKARHDERDLFGRSSDGTSGTSGFASGLGALDFFSGNATTPGGGVAGTPQ